MEIEELHRGDVGARYDGTMVMRRWRLTVCPDTFRRNQISGLANPGRPWQWPLNRCVCVCVRVYGGSVCVWSCCLFQRPQEPYQIIIRFTVPCERIIEHYQQLTGVRWHSSIYQSKIVNVFFQFNGVKPVPVQSCILYSILCFFHCFALHSVVVSCLTRDSNISLQMVFRVSLEWLVTEFSTGGCEAISLVYTCVQVVGFELDDLWPRYLAWWFNRLDPV